MNILNHIPLFLNKTDISKRILVFLLFAFFVLYFFISTKILWVLYLMFLAVLILSRMKFVIKPIIIVSILSLPILWGLVMSYNESLYNTVQGFFYLSIPLLLIIIGFQLSKILSIKHYFSIILMVGNIISIMFIMVAIYKIGFSAFLSPYTKARFVLGSGSPACVLSLIISLYSDKFDFNLFKNNTRRILSIIVSLAAIYLFASRTYWVMLIIFIIIFSFKTIRNDKLIALIFLSFAAVLIFLNLIYTDNGLSFSNSLIYKLTHSFKEIELSNFKTLREINQNFRGYEAYRSWETYIDGNPCELVFGLGLGKLVHLNMQMLLDGKLWTDIPIVHNGFFYILVKTGAFGIAFILLFFFFFVLIGFKRCRSKNYEQQFIGLFILACGASLFMTNFVICGLYNFEISILLITSGFIISKHYIQIHPELENVKSEL
jgi:hypothetical protein